MTKTEEQRAKSREYQRKYLSKFTLEERRAQARNRVRKCYYNKKILGYEGFACQIKPEWREKLMGLLKTLQKDN